MYQKKEYATLRTVSNLTSGFGWIIVGIFFLAGLVIGWKAGGLIEGIFSGAIAGIAVGIPLIVMGQMVAVFLDQKDLLELILEALKKK